MSPAPGSPAETTRLRTGTSMPVLGLGTWELTDDTAGTVEAAIEMGYRLVDTSGDYGSQPGIADALRRSSVDRDEIFLVTKVEEDEDAYAATKARLSELDVTRVDLILVHRPPATGAGVELWRGLQRARNEGMAVDIGVSNYSIEQLDELSSVIGEVPVVNQIEWSPFGWSQRMLDYCNQSEIVIQAYSPLTRANRLDDEVVAQVAARYGRSPAQILLRWSLQMGVVPLPKANDHQHLRENLGAFDFELLPDEMARLQERNERWSALGASLQYT